MEKAFTKKIMPAMDRLKQRGIPFGTSLTVTSQNVERLTSDDFFDHLTNKGVMVCWFFLFMPVGKNPDVQLMPSPDQREYLRRRGSALRVSIQLSGARTNKISCS